MKKIKPWLYLAPAILFLGFFMVYPLIDVFIYSFEEGYNSASQTFRGIGLYNGIRISSRLSRTHSFLSSSRFRFPPESRC